MAVRIRNPIVPVDGVAHVTPDPVIVCAAQSDPMEGDLYVDDGLHYVLVQLGILFTQDEGDSWHLAIPADEPS